MPAVRGRSLITRAQPAAARATGPRRRRLLRGSHLAAHLLAAALGDVLPLGRVVVDLRALCRARVLRGATVVLAGLGDAVALLGAGLLRRGLRGHHRGEAERDEARERGLDPCLIV